MNRSRRRWLILLAVAALLAVASVMILPRWLATRISEAISTGTGATCVIDGIGFGREVTAERMTLTPPDARQPFLEIRSVSLRPDWIGLMAGSLSFDSLEVDSVVIHAGPEAEAWLGSRREEPAQRGERAEWRIRNVRVPQIRARWRDLEAEGMVEAKDLGSRGGRGILLRMGIMNPGAEVVVTGETIDLDGLWDTGRWRIHAEGNDPLALVRAFGVGIETAAPILAPWLAGLPNAGHGGKWRLSVERAAPSALGSDRGDPATTSIASMDPIAGGRRLLSSVTGLSCEILWQAESGETVFALAMQGETDTSASIEASLLRAGRANLRIGISDGLFEIEGTAHGERGGPAGEFRVSTALALGLTGDYLLRDGSHLDISGFHDGRRRQPGLSLRGRGDARGGYMLEGQYGACAAGVRLRLDSSSIEFRLEGSTPEFGSFYGRGLDLAGRLIEDQPGRWRLNVEGRGVVEARGKYAGSFKGSVQLRATRAVVATEVAADSFAFLRRLHEVSDELLDAGGWSAYGELSRLAGHGRIGRNDWSVTGEKLTFRHDRESTTLELARPLEIKGFGSTLSLEGGLERRGLRISTKNLLLARIPIEGSAEWKGAALAGARVKIGPVRPAAVRAFLPAELASSTIEGEASAEVEYAVAANEVRGDLIVDLKRFLDPACLIEIRDLVVRVPIRQRFVDPGSVVFESDEMRYPAISENLAIGRLTGEGVRIENVRGKILFDRYVLRAYDLRGDVLGGEANAVIWIDPFRRPDGRCQTILDLDVRGLALGRVYEAFVGTGEAARSIDGAVSGLVTARFYDFTPDTYTVLIESDGSGRIGPRVIEALNGMQPPEKRLPRLALVFLGRYQYEKILLHAMLAPDGSETLLKFALESPRHPLLKEMRLVVPLRTMLEGLPAEARVGLGDRRQRREGKP